MHTDLTAIVWEASTNSSKSNAKATALTRSITDDGILAAWIGAGALLRISKERVVAIIAVLLVGIAGLLVAETLFAGSTHLALPADQFVRIPVALATGVIVGTVSSMLGVAGGELIIPILIFVFGADIKTAGTSSVLISVPIVIAGIARHVMTGHFRSRSMLTYLYRQLPG